MQVAVTEQEDAGTRLDLFLARRKLAASEWSRAAIQKMIQEGAILLNGLRPKPSTRLRLNDLVEIRALPVKNARVMPEPIPLDVLYEDADCIAVNKPPGIVVHPAAGKQTGTLVNALLYHCRDLEGIGGEQRPGIVHRLDKDTSGVMIVAKHDRAFRGLALQFKERRILKEYVALVWGKVKTEKGHIRRPIGRHRRDRKRMSSLYALPRLREATTEWQVEERFRVGSAVGSWVTWLRVKPYTGRTHQIRVHLSDEGFPIVGDKIYGQKQKRLSTLSPAELLNFPRQALHAERLRFDHPVTGRPVEIRAPLFPDMEGLLQRLRKPERSIEKQSVGG
jgi:23S rRNA pseudouridine1911/1915/1917 synthase